MLGSALSESPPPLALKHWAYAVLAIGILALSIGAAHAASDDSPPAILNTIQNFEISTNETAKLYLHTKFTDDGTMTYTADAEDSTIVFIQTHKSRVAMTGIVEGTTPVTACASDGTNDPTCQTFMVDVQLADVPIKISNAIQNFEISTGETAKLYLHTKFSGQSALEYTADAADSAIVSVQTDGSRVVMTGLKEGTTQVTACASDGTNDPTCQTFRVSIQPSATPIKTSNTIQNFEISTGETAKLYLHTKFSGQGTLEYTADAADSTIVSIQTDGSRVAMTGLKAGITQVTACASNGAGESLCQKYRVTITAGLIIVPPSDVTAEATGVLTVVDIGTANHDSIRITNDAPDSFPLGDTIVTWSADGHESATQTVTIQDTTPPEFDRLRDIKIGVSPELPLLFYNTPSASDLVDDSVDVSCTPARETAATFGTVSVACIATDDSGNSNTGSFDVTIAPFDGSLTPDTLPYDLHAPIITAPDDITAEATGNLTEVDIGTAVAKDADGDFPMVTSNAPDSYPLGDIIVTWTATNSDGFVSRATQRITIQDTTPPVFTFAHEPLVTSESSIQAVIPPPVATDIFGIGDITCTYPASNIYYLGSNDITCTAVDTNGNESTESFNVEVLSRTGTIIQITPEHPDRTSGFGKYVERIDDSMIVSGRYLTGSDRIPSIFPFENVAESDGPERWIADGRITDPGNSPNNRFANAISFDGQTIMATSNDLTSASGTQNSGAVYVFEKNAEDEWTEKQKISLGHLIESTGNFRSIAMNGNSMAVSSYSSTPDFPSGIVDIYERQGADQPWTYAERISPYISGLHGSFGRGLAMDDNYLVIGSAYADAVVQQSGAAYILEKNSAGNWIRTATLQPADLRSASTFGENVAISGDTVIVGAKYLRDRDTGSLGAAYVFEKDDSGAWQQVQKLMADTPSHRYFGVDVNVYGDTMAVSSHHLNGGSAKSIIYIYEKNGSTWNNVATIDPDFYIFSSPDSLELDTNSMLVGDVNGVANSKKTGLLTMYLGDLSSFNSP